MKKILIIVFLAFISAFSIAQERNTVEMADTMRNNGKIYVVVTVILTIFAGIIFYLVRLDRKINKLEKQTTQNKI